MKEIKIIKILKYYEKKTIVLNLGISNVEVLL